MRPVFLGNEASQAPEVVELVAVARRIAAAAGPKTAGTLSLRNGPRCIVNVADTPFAAVGLGDFVEVADFDPLTGRLFCLGTRGPPADAPLHAMLYRAKAEIGAVAEVALREGHAALEGLPQVAREDRPLPFAMAVVRALRDADAVALGETDLLVASRSLPGLARRIETLLGGASP